MLCAHHALTMHLPRAYTLCGLTTGLLEVDTIYSTYLRTCSRLSLTARALLRKVGPCLRAKRSHRDRIEVARPSVRHANRQCAVCEARAPAATLASPTPPLVPGGAAPVIRAEPCR